MDEFNSMFYESRISPIWENIHEGKPRSGKSFNIIKDTVELERTVNMLKESGYQIKMINLNNYKKKYSTFNPTIQEKISKIKEKAKRAIAEKKYSKAYKLLGKIKKLKNNSLQY